MHIEKQEKSHKGQVLPVNVIQNIFESFKHLLSHNTEMYSDATQAKS